MSDLPPDLDLHQSLLWIAQNPTLRKDLERVLGGYCHQGRNRLNSLKLSIYLAKRQAPGGDATVWQSVEQAYQIVETQIDRLQMVCRPMSLALVNIGLNLLFDDRSAGWSATLGEAGHHVVFQPPDGANLARFDVDKLGMALDALVAWRAEQGVSGTRILVKWWVHNREAQISWSEQRPTNAPDQLQIHPGSTAWTLPILIRVVTEHGGRLRVDEDSGWHLAISWPASVA